MKTIEIECPSCKGTGLYVGMCEREGSAVVCTTCGGKGYTTYSYNEFTGKKVKEGVKRVFKKTCGYVHGAEDYTTPEGKVIHFSQYGCTYEEWLNGKEPKPMEELYCPYVYYNKGIGSEPLEKCRGNLSEWGMITKCKLYFDKENCWKEFYEKEEKNDISEKSPRINK